MNRAHRFKHSLGLIVLDIDHYKEFNDAHGHAAGDQVLRVAAKICRDGIREIDVIGRYGGDEFVIVLPECSLETAVVVAERVRNSAGKQLRSWLASRNCQITLSAGVASDPVGSLSLDDLLRQADRALYAAKSAGRNCVR